MSSTKNLHSTGNGSGATGAHAAHPVYSATQREMVKEQLERILASSLFRNSKRFPDFLRYTVNQALAGETDCLKERMLGVSVFGRDADYDTSTDPVVRVTAAEVRKRITQYYEALGHEREMRVEFERGSYVPEFKFSYDSPRHEMAAPATASNEKRQWNTKHWLLAGGVITPCLAVCIFLLGSTRQTALDRFWAPVISANGPALVCIPNPARPPSRYGTASLPPQGESGFAPQTAGFIPHVVSLGDSVALSMVSRVLGREAEDFRVRATEDVTLDDLKEGPVVLIGAFSNQWTMRLANGLRFAFEHDGSSAYIADMRNPSSRQWEVSNQLASGGASVDYGIISRVIDATTGHSVVTVAGIHHFGTEASAECLTETTCLEAAAALAPGDWKKKNLQIVLRTTVIGQNSGQPQVLAAYAW
ncbi:MAG TPA: hypothetical protein VJN69_01915 [Candidatus Acidoferrales bacterium]|nr:hypothetical protein [Candidatus Acidoferrales bacterium]